MATIKKRILTRLGLLTSIAVGGFLLLAWWTAPNCLVNRELFDQIEVGMSRNQVEQIIGCPAGYYCTGHAAIEFEGGTTDAFWIDCKDLATFESWIWPPGEIAPNQSWVTNTGALQLVLDPNDNVVNRHFYQVKVSGWFETVQGWLAKF